MSRSEFYRSRSWREFVELLKIERTDENGFIICAHCGKPIVKKYDCIGHHKEELTEENYENPEISLNPDNVVLVHQRCHNLIHDKLGYVEKKVYIVYGSPLSGKSSYVTYAVNAVVKIPTVMGKEKSENAIKELNEKLKNSESGLAAIDMKAEYIPIKKEVKLVDKDTLEFIDQKILRTFGVPLPILIGDYTKAQYEAFYQKTIEPLIISLSQVLTDKLLSDGERSHGNLIKLYPKELIFMSMSETLEMIRLVGDSGGLYENEKRTALGLMPLEELNGVRMQSLNYANVEIADKYQLGKVDGKKEA